MGAADVIALVALVVSAALSTWAAISAERASRAARDSADVARQALLVNQAGVQISQSVRDWQDRPRFQMAPDAGPTGNRWWITVKMVDGPTRVEARWLHQGEVMGPWQGPGNGYRSRSVSLVLGERGGPAFLHKGSTFRVGVECSPDTMSLSVTVSVYSAELRPGTDDEPTGRQWPHIQAVAAEAFAD